MKCGTVVRRLLFVLAALMPLLVRAQVQVAGFARWTNAVSFTTHGGHGPYLVRTSRDLHNWSDQGGPEAGPTHTLAAYAEGGFYQVTDLNPSGLYGSPFGLIQSAQGEFGELMARHRLKSRLWLYRTKDAPHTSATYRTTNYWGRLIANFQTHWKGEVQTWVGALEDLGRITTPTANHMTISWTNGAGPDRRVFNLSFEFPYSVSATRNNGGSTAPRASDPDIKLRCTYATAQPEWVWTGDRMDLRPVTRDETGLVQMDPNNPANPFPAAQKYVVSAGGVKIDLHFLEGAPLVQGEPPWILKTFLLDRWLSPTTAGGRSLPAFRTDSYFSRTLLPGHHNFYEIVLLEPALDPALSEATRAALVAANIRYVYTFKDIGIGMSPDDILYFGFDDKVRTP